MNVCDNILYYIHNRHAMKCDPSLLLAAEWKVESQFLRIVGLLTVHLLIDGLTVIGGLVTHQWRDI